MKRSTVKYLDLAETLRGHIAGLGPNSLLPTELQLTRRFGISRSTVRRALDVLERSGFVLRQRGRGTITSPPKITRRFLPLYMLEEDLRQQKIKFGTQVVEFQPRLAPPELVRDRLRLSTTDSVGFLSLRRLVEDRPVCHDRRYFPAPAATKLDPSMILDRSVSEVLAELDEQGPVATIAWECEILPALPDVAAVLNLTPGALIVESRFTLYLDNGTPIETGTVSYRIDRFTFMLTGRFSSSQLA